ncbi:MAG: hypothetical protein DRP29_08490 [Thermodesulfobacteriota bacterium]|nr:MAG: hypothetical protein DRP29_08490 [Thermodesulfobacteriota bacterium]
MAANFRDKRYYTRYRVRLDGIIAHEKGLNFPVEILDISAEGARLKTDVIAPIHVGDRIYLLIKWKSKIKVKAEIRWMKKKENFLEFGVRFIEMDMAVREALSGLISDYALSSLLDIYTR